MGKAKQIVRSTDKETKQRLQERQQPDPMERICPLCFETSGSMIGSYEQTPLTTTPFLDNDGHQQEDFLWKSHPNVKLTDEGEAIKKDKGWAGVTREHLLKDSSRMGHALQFYQGLEMLRLKGDIMWEEEAYYYTHTEGMEALDEALLYATKEDPENKGWPVAYELLNGEKVYIKANKRSWENRFAEKTGMTFEELQERFPELYGKMANKKEKVEAEEKPQGDGMNARRHKMKVEEDDSIPQEKLKEMGLEDPVEQLEETLDTLQGPDTIKEMEEVEVTAVTVAEADNEVKELIESAAHDEEADDHDVVVLRLTGYDSAERMSEDHFIRSMNGEHIHYYEVELPELNYPIWVTPEESLNVNGTTYRFMEED